MTLQRLRHRSGRAAMARVPDRPAPISLIGPQIEAARAVWIAVEEQDRHHVRLEYDARDRDQWLAVDQLLDVAYTRSTVEGDRSFESAPNNWIVIHFDYGACGGEAKPNGPDR